MVTLKDIAKEAGVSVMTVSRVVNGQHSKVSSKHIEKIQKIIKERGYIPSSAARSLSSKSSHIISVIIRGTGNQLKDSYFASMVGEIVSDVQERGYYLMLHFINRYDDITQRLRAWNAEGCIFLGTFDNDIQQIQQDNLIPLVFTDSYSNIRQITNVGIDDYKGGVLAAQHFISQGHKSFAFVGYSSASSVVQHRLNGFRDTLEASGYRLDNSHIFEAEDKMPIEKIAKSIRSFREPVTAIFATADLLAISLMDCFKNMGCKIPDDYSFIGFDDLSISRLVTPPLTTITQDIGKKARIAVDILFRHINDNSLPAENAVLDVSLVSRQSVKNLNL